MRKQSPHALNRLRSITRKPVSRHHLSSPLICALLCLSTQVQVAFASPTSELNEAASAGDLDKIKALVAKYPEAINEDYPRPPLNFAIAGDHLNVARFLLEQGADVNIQDAGRSYPLPLIQVLENAPKDWKQFADLLIQHGAVANYSWDWITHHKERPIPADQFLWLLDNGLKLYLYSPSDGKTGVEMCFDNAVTDPKLLASCVDPKWRNDRGETLLFAAARSGSTDALRTLVVRGADINACNGEGETVLHQWASRSGQPELLPTLLELGANPNLPNSLGDLPLHCAIRSIEHDLPANSATPYDEWNIQYKSPSQMHSDIEQENNKRLIPLVALTDINARGDGDFTPLLQAIVTGNAKLYEVIRARTPKLDSISAFLDAIASDKTPLVTATLRDKPHFAFFRLSNGETPLHIAARWGSSGAARALIARGADINARDALNQTPLLLATKQAERSRTVLTLLLSHGANPNIASKAHDTPLLLAARENDAESVVRLLDAGANVNAHDAKNCTPLLRSLQPKTPIGLLNALLAHGADVNTRGEDVLYSPLHIAVLLKRPDIVDVLLQYHPNLEIKNREAQTALGLLVGKWFMASDERSDIRFKPMAASLLAAGADPNSNFSLETAVSHQNAEAVRLLLSSPKVSLQQSTPLISAVQNEDKDIVKLLLDAGADPIKADSDKRTPLYYANIPEIKQLLLERIDRLQNGTNPPAIQPPIR